MRSCDPCSLPVQVSTEEGGVRQGAEDRSFPPSVLCFLSSQSDGNRPTACRGGGQRRWHRASLEKGQRTERKRGQGRDCEITEVPKSASVSGLFVCLQGDGEGRGKHQLHTELHKRPQNRNHVTDRHRYCVHAVFTGNTRAVMNHFCGCAPRLSSHMSPLTPDHDLDPPASLVTQSNRYRAYY